MSEFAPMDILGKKFSKKMNGYAPIEVHDYLTDLARVVEEMLRERSDLARIGGAWVKGGLIRQGALRLGDPGIRPGQVLDEDFLVPGTRGGLRCDLSLNVCERTHAREAHGGHPRFDARAAP